MGILYRGMGMGMGIPYRSMGMGILYRGHIVGAPLIILVCYFSISISVLRNYQLLSSTAAQSHYRVVKWNLNFFKFELLMQGMNKR